MEHAVNSAPTQTPSTTIKVIECNCGQVRFVFNGQFACWEKCPHCGYYELLAWSSAQNPVMVLS